MKLKFIMEKLRKYRQFLDIEKAPVKYKKKCSRCLSFFENVYLFDEESDIVDISAFLRTEYHSLNLKYKETNNKKHLEKAREIKLNLKYISERFAIDLVQDLLKIRDHCNYRNRNIPKHKRYNFQSRNKSQVKSKATWKQID